MKTENTHLFPGWEDALRKFSNSTSKQEKHAPLPKLPDYFASKLTYVNTADDASAMLHLRRQRPLPHIGFDTEFQYIRPPVIINEKKQQFATDPYSVKPLLLSLTMVEETKGQQRLYSFVVDLRCVEVIEAVREVFRLPIPFVAHYATAELYSLWQLGIDEPGIIWDTFIAEKARIAGRHALPRRDEDDPAAMTEAEEEEAKEKRRLRLVSVCRRYKVPHSMSLDKDRLRQSFLTHPDGVAFSAEQIAYASADADAAALLYFPQLQVSAAQGLLHHLITIEMPFVAVNARVNYNGVRIDPKKCRSVKAACDTYLPHLEQRLESMGIGKFKSHPQLKAFFEKEGLLHLFKKREGFTFDKQHLKEFGGRHPAIALLHEARRVQSLKTDKIFWEEMVGIDGRVHAENRQLGAVSGRQSCRWPNLLGLPSVMRPLIVPDPGYGIGEVDLSQIEIGIAAAYYHDENLIKLFNTGDAYSAMAQMFFHEKLSAGARSMPTGRFKKKYRAMREQMKTCTLGIIYGLSSFGLAARLNVTTWEADEVLKKFMAMFPQLSDALSATVNNGVICGFSTTVTGLRRYRSQTGALTNWEKNWMRNHPIQGTAADLFKTACIRLYHLYRQYNAKLILLVHDAVVFEAPLAALNTVAELTRQVLCQAVIEFFPELRPGAQMNISHPECWNKDGKHDSIKKWLRKAKSA